MPLAIVGLVPIGLSVGFAASAPSGGARRGRRASWGCSLARWPRALNGILLVAAVLILMNLEQTFRSAVGTMRWRIKFVILAVAVIFGARLYVRSQAILFSAPDFGLWSVESGALLIGCAFLTIAYMRTGLAEIDVYPSLAASDRR